jgi:hypothetical protein
MKLDRLQTGRPLPAHRPISREARSFETSDGIVVPALIMQRIVDRLRADEDWQAIASELLHPFVPEGEDEVLTEAEGRLLLVGDVLT